MRESEVKPDNKFKVNQELEQYIFYMFMESKGQLKVPDEDTDYWQGRHDAIKAVLKGIDIQRGK